MKVLNVFGIIIAWLLSIVLVLMLIAAPLTLTTLSVLDPENIVDVVVKGLTDNDKSAATQQDYAFEKLAASKETSLAESVMEALDLEEIEDIVGEKLDEDVVAEVLASDAVSEIFEAYANDIANALTDERGKKEFTAKNLKKIVNDNLDEIVDAIEDAGVSMTKSEKKEVKEKIDSAVQENADKIIDTLPAPKEIAEVVVEDNILGELVAEFLAQREMLKAMMVGGIVLLSLLIFFLRIPGFRGLRWLASDLFTAGGVNVLVCLGLGISTSAIKELTEDMDSQMLDGIVGKFVTQLTTGMVIRTIIMVVAAVVLLVAYYLLKGVSRKKKTEKEPAPVVNPVVVPTVTPVFTPAPAPAPVVAPVIPVVTIEPEIVTEPVVAEEEPAAEPEAPAAEETAEAPAEEV